MDDPSRLMTKDAFNALPYGIMFLKVLSCDKNNFKESEYIKTSMNIDFLFIVI